jgi:uncharacterized membrane protein YoaK (UPF0700 family)
MFRQGKQRAFIHNLSLASLLSFVAGMVNISGVLAIGTLTTNVTGHFAFFAEEFSKGEYQTAITFLSYILFFFLGAFTSSMLVELIQRRKPDKSHALPMLLEISILVFVTIAARRALLPPEGIARTLLFAMGLQNALVTKVSQATVRTTHLTGLFTDLGIEISQLFFYSDRGESKKLSKSIYLRLTIIVFFFIGGVLGGFLFKEISVYTFLAAAAILVIALAFDNIRLSVHSSRGKMKQDA